MSPSAPALAALKEFVGANHILFGSDWPMVSESVAGRTVSELEELPFFDERTKEHIFGHNATQLFVRFRS